MTQAAIRRTRDPEAAVEDIIAVARKEFADRGLSGARVDEIAARTRTSKRMIYYYFGGKEGLYRAVLEDAYRRMRAVEAGLELDGLPPLEALRKLVAFTFDHQVSDPDFVRLVMNENIHRGVHLARSEKIQGLNWPAIEAVRRICERGRAEGAFRDDLDPVDLHMSISALCFFNVANRHTFSLIFKRDMSSPEALAGRRRNIEEIVLRYVRA
jgi:AcrR family transcriptional regulator